MKYIVPFEIEGKIVFQDYRKYYKNRKEWYHKHYTKTEYWRKLKARTLLINPLCVSCDAKYRLELHHLNYDSLGKEIPGKDVIILCRKCHQLTYGGKSLDDIKSISKHKPVYFNNSIKRFSPENYYLMLIDLKRIRDCLPKNHLITWDDALMSLTKSNRYNQITKKPGIDMNVYCELKKSFKAIITHLLRY